jgi:hypothetical protein
VNVRNASDGDEIVTILYPIHSFRGPFQIRLLPGSLGTTFSGTCGRNLREFL